VTNWQPLAALESAKPLTQASAVHSCGFARQRQYGWSSDTRERRRDGGGTGLGGRTVYWAGSVCVLGSECVCVWSSEEECCCVWTSDSDRAKAESRSVSGARH
jgi:hypothetical protein